MREKNDHFIILFSIILLFICSIFLNVIFLTMNQPNIHLDKILSIISKQTLIDSKMLLSILLIIGIFIFGLCLDKFLSITYKKIMLLFNAAKLPYILFNISLILIFLSSSMVLHLDRQSINGSFSDMLFSTFNGLPCYPTVLVAITTINNIKLKKER